MNVYTELDIDDYERVVKCVNDEVGLIAWIAIHSIKLGPSFGGCRMWKYNTEEEAVTDVLRLSKGMTYKNALAGLPLGGGKSVIWGDAKTQKTPELIEAMGEFVEYISGDYIIAEDVGMTVEDIMAMRAKTKYTVSRSAGNPGPFTAHGVAVGIMAACDHKFGNVSEISVVIQGIGSVGYHLTKILAQTSRVKFKILVTDINDSAVDRVVKEFGVIPLTTWHREQAIYSMNCNVFAPCALGGIINDDTIGDFRCDIIAGSANNQLLEDRHGVALNDMGILYAPDYVINAGGVIMVSGDREDGTFDKNLAFEKVNNIGNTLTEIFEESKVTGIPTHIIADKIAEKRLYDK